ncbi:MAG: hypothetical protein ABSG57_10990 [Candidatus Bathyarchaeia archaeon]
MKWIFDLQPMVTSTFDLVLSAPEHARAHGGMLAFPNMPRLFDLWSKYGQRVKATGEDRYIGRQLFSIFAQAGFSSIDIHPFPISGTQQNPEAFKMLVGVPVQILERDKGAMINEGIAKAEDFREMLHEFKSVLSHPGAFAMGLSFLAIGKNL